MKSNDYWNYESAQYLREQYGRPNRSAATIYHGETRLARASDLRDVLNVGSPLRLEGATLLLEQENGRGSEMEAVLGDINLSLEDHTIIVGSSGSGKSQKLIEPLLISALKYSPDIIVTLTDFKQSIGPRANYLANLLRGGLTYINFTASSHSRSVNLLSQVRDMQTAMRLSTVMCKNAIESSHDSPFWRLSSEELFTGMFVVCNKIDRNANMADVRRVLKLGVKDFQVWSHRHQGLDPTGALKRFSDYITTGSHNAETILQTAANVFNVFMDEAIAETTGRADLDIKTMVTKPGQCYLIEVPETDAKRLEPVTNLFSDLRTEMRLKAGNHDTPLIEIIDEFNLLGAIKDAPLRLNTLRERKTTVVVAVQTLSQLHSRYGSEAADLLAGFNNKILLSPCAQVDAEAASAESGVISVEASQPDGALINFAPPVTRQLLLPEEIRRPAEHPTEGRPVTFFLGHRQPFQALLAPAWSAMAGRETKIPPRSVLPTIKPSTLLTCLTTSPSTTAPSETNASATKLAAKPGISDTRLWSEAKIERHFTKVVRPKLQYRAAAPEVKAFWKELIQKYALTKASVLRLGEELVVRNETVASFHESYHRAPDKSIVGILRFIDQTRGNH